MKKKHLISIICTFCLNVSLNAQVLTGANIDALLNKSGINEVASFLRIKKYIPVVDTTDYWGYYVVWGNNYIYDDYGVPVRIDRSKTYHRLQCYFENENSKPYRLYYETGSLQPLISIVNYYKAKGYELLGVDENGSDVYGKENNIYEIHFHKESRTFAIYIVHF